MAKRGPKGRHKLTPEVVGKLEIAFAMGSSVKDACIFGGISKDSYYDLIKKNPKLSDRFDTLRLQPIFQAKQTIMKNLHDPRIAAWYLERKQRDEFGKNVTPSQDDTYWDTAQQKKKQWEEENYRRLTETPGSDITLSSRAIALMLEHAKKEVAEWEATLARSKEKDALRLAERTPTFVP